MQEKHEKFFEEIKETLATDCIFKIPDTSKTFILTTDASNVAVSGILGQMTEKAEEIIAYFSLFLNAAQSNYSATDKESSAIVKAVENFNHF